MFTIEVYRGVLNKILDFIRNPRQNNQSDGLMLETQGESTAYLQSDIIDEPPRVTFTEEEMRVVNVLNDEGDIIILSTINEPSGNKFTGSGRLIPNGDIIVEIDLSGDDLPHRIETRLSDLDSWLKEYSHVFGDVSDGRTIETGRHQGFVSYGSGLITFMGKPVILPKRDAYLLAYFISHAGQLVYATEIVDNYYTGESNDSPMTICSKIISPLNSALKDITHTANVIKTVDAQYAYILELT